MRERDEPHSYRHEPSAPMENYSLFIIGEGDGDEDGSGGDEDGFRVHFPVPAGCQNGASVP